VIEVSDWSTEEGGGCNRSRPSSPDRRARCFEPPIIPDPRSDPEELTQRLEKFFSTPVA